MTYSFDKARMTHSEHNHYFIELLHDLAPTLSSGAVVTARQERARTFAKTLQGWLNNAAMTDDVSDLKVTALGRVMITCHPAVVDWLVELDHPDVIAITLSSTRGQNAPQTIMPRSA